MKGSVLGTRDIDVNKEMQFLPSFISMPIYGKTNYTIIFTTTVKVSQEEKEL